MVLLDMYLIVSSANYFLILHYSVINSDVEFVCVSLISFCFFRAHFVYISQAMVSLCLPCYIP